MPLIRSDKLPVASDADIVTVRQRVRALAVESGDPLVASDPFYRAEPLDSTPQPADGALLIYTSGTTGKPKGVLLTQANVMAGIEYVSRGFEMRPGDTLLLKPGMVHRFTSLDGDAHIFEFSTQHFDEDSHRIEKGD